MRYLDLFMYFISLYNTFMKLFFISSTAFIIYLMRYKKPFCTVSSITSKVNYRLMTPWETISPTYWCCYRALWL